MKEFADFYLWELIHFYSDFSQTNQRCLIWRDCSGWSEAQTRSGSFELFITHTRVCWRSWHLIWTRTHSIYKICYGKIWGLHLLQFLKYFYISASQTEVYSLSQKKATMFTVYVTFLSTTEIKKFNGGYRAYKHQETSPAFLKHSKPQWVYMCFWTRLCHRLKRQSADVTLWLLAMSVTLVCACCTKLSPLILSATQALPSGHPLVLWCVVAGAPVTDSFWPGIK